MSPNTTDLDPAMNGRKALVDFFARSLTAFQSSKDAFHVVCTLPPRGETAGEASGEFSTSTPAPAPRRPNRNDVKARPVESLVVLDSSFNPPTLAHLRMAASAVRDLQKGRSTTTATRGDGAGESSSVAAGELGQRRAVRLLLLLAVNNADKKPKPAAFEVRLGMMYAFARDLRDEVRRRGVDGAEEEQRQQQEEEEDVEVDLGLTTMPYFHDKSQAISDTRFYARGDGGGEPEQVYLAGYDTLIRIFNPKYYNASSSSSPGGTAVEEAEAPIRRALDPFLGRSRLRITMRTDDEWGGEGEQVAYLKSLRDGGLEDVGGRRAWAERVEMVRGRDEGEEVVSSTKVREAASARDEEMLGRLVSARVKGWVLGEGLYPGDEGFVCCFVYDMRQVRRDVVDIGEWAHGLIVLLMDIIEPENLVSFKRQQAI
ncbi:cytidylyltransferase [Colletotrichum paranaense]|uniref:Cytidylyltransferase n=1 Tax=Colletotrichum paranaense TaxID=1914294 RepID=A0ABQ9SZN5_9PEZI|nr:cytidylyltransferase [Colletotrichum paranaense]KAK1544983.1 cytidylyltransferase [Colletotrichum paranaense]